MAGIMRAGDEAMKNMGDALRAAGFGFVVLALIGLFLGAWAGYKPHHEMKTWPAVDAEVVQSAITSRMSRSGGTRIARGTVYGATFIFRYTVGGQQYVAQRDVGYETSSESEMAKWVGQIPKGSHRIIHYDPASPLRISLAVGFDSFSFAPTLLMWRWAAIFGGIGIVLLVVASRWGKKEAAL